jgi:hypothetical protein
MKLCLLLFRTSIIFSSSTGKRRDVVTAAGTDELKDTYPLLYEDPLNFFQPSTSDPWIIDAKATDSKTPNSITGSLFNAEMRQISLGSGLPLGDVFDFFCSLETYALMFNESKLIDYLARDDVTIVKKFDAVFLRAARDLHLNAFAHMAEKLKFYRNITY